MTLDEAIKHAEEVADGHDRIKQIKAVTLEECKKCAYEHRQLAEWLEELKQLREQTRWIPCSERLPEEGGDYLVTICYDLLGKGTVREVRRNFFCILSKKWLYEGDDVIAWMPLPGPYKAESEDKE